MLIAVEVYTVARSGQQLSLDINRLSLRTHLSESRTA
jgi:hypothetical protein